MEHHLVLMRCIQQIQVDQTHLSYLIYSSHSQKIPIVCFQMDLFENTKISLVNHHYPKFSMACSLQKMAILERAAPCSISRRTQGVKAKSTAEFQALVADMLKAGGRVVPDRPCFRMTFLGEK